MDGNATDEDDGDESISEASLSLCSRNLRQSLSLFLNQTPGLNRGQSSVMTLSL